MTAQEILRVLVGIPTPYSVSNLLLIDWVKRFLEGKGWRVELFPYTDEREVDKANLIARPPGAPTDESPIDLAFVCHTDTSLLALGWTSALELTASGGGTFLHGCGAADAKGALACFVAAVDGLPPNGVHPGVALILTADEEIGCKGMRRLLDSTKLHLRAAIVSEPTSLRPGIAGKGYGMARITVKGIEAHSAYPLEGLSAITQAAKLIERIDKLGTQFSGNAAQNADPLFDPPRTTVNIGVIQGGTAKNIVPGECWFLVEWRPIPADPPRAFLTELEWVVDSVRLEEPRVRIHVEAFRSEAGFSLVEPGPLQVRLRAIGEKAGNPRLPTGISFGSEATRLAAVSDEVIVLGPGDMHTAHSSRECVPAAELLEWTATLSALLAAPVAQ
jgi:acetylornithine deacetylase